MSGSIRGRASHLASFLVACSVGACGEAVPADVPRAEVTPAGPAADALPEPTSTPASWPVDVEDLALSLQQFETFEQCLAALRARTPTAVAEGIADLEYDGFFEDVCRATEAVRDRAPDRCDALAVSTLRRGCRRRVAIVAGDPAFCPDDRTIEGREPLCVAWAARAPGLCRSTAASDRLACTAVLANDRDACARDPDRSRCEAWIARYAGSLETERATAPGTREDPSLRVTLVRVYPGGTSSVAREDEPIELELDVLARGVFLAADGCGYRVILDDRGERAVLPIQRSGARASFPIAVGPLPMEIAFGPGLASIEVTHPSHGRASGAEGTLALTAMGAERGAAIAGSFEATMPMVPGTMRVRGTFRSFVRDLDALPERCASDRMPSP